MLPPHEHDDNAVSPSDPGMYMSAGRTYARVGIQDPARMYVHCHIFFLAHSLLYVRVHATCAPVLRHMHASTSTSIYVHVRDQNDNATYASTRWVPTVTHFLACEDIAGGSQQSGGRIIFFARTLFLACEDAAGGPQQSGETFFPRNTVARPVGPSCQVEESLFSA